MMKTVHSKKKLSKNVAQLNMSCTLTSQGDRNQIAPEYGPQVEASWSIAPCQSVNQLQACVGRIKLLDEATSIRSKAIFWKSGHCELLEANSDCS